MIILIALVSLLLVKTLYSYSDIDAWPQCAQYAIFPNNSALPQNSVFIAVYFPASKSAYHVISLF
jgi:hypothetical protein